jgi:hypothetical protein
MVNFFKFVLIIIRILICYKVVSLLYFSTKDYDQTTLNNLIWWGVFLIFDIWLQFVLPSSYNDDEK